MCVRECRVLLGRGLGSSFGCVHSVCVQGVGDGNACAQTMGAGGVCEREKDAHAHHQFQPGICIVVAKEARTETERERDDRRPQRGDRRTQHTRVDIDDAGQQALLGTDHGARHPRVVEAEDEGAGVAAVAIAQALFWFCELGI